MKAVILKDKQKLVVEEIPVPVAGDNEVLVKIRAVSICGSDLHIYNTALFGPDLVMGHELSGTIVKLGNGVEGWNEGDDVWVAGGGPCTRCLECLRGKYDQCTDFKIIAAGDYQGGFAEYIKVPYSFLSPIPNGVSFREASQVDTLGIAFRAVEIAGVGIGTSALVLGGGAIGLYAVQCLKAVGAEPIILSEPTQHRAELGRKFGADIILDPSTENVEERLMELTGGQGADVVLECAGRPETVVGSITMARRRSGTVVLMGVCLEPITLIPWEWVERDITVHFMNGTGGDPIHNKCLKSLEEKRFAIDEIITSSITLDELPAAFERLVKPNDEVKVVVEFD